jgi:hypothetical protein
MLALCIDPGPENSGVVEYDGYKLGFVSSNVSNQVLVDDIIRDSKADVMLLEMVASYGMAVGATVFETCVWIGRFGQQFGWNRVKLIYRRDVKLYLCNSLRAKNSNVRQDILDEFPRDGGGKTPQIGTKKNPGPLYGVSSHSFSALALGVTFFGNSDENKN